MKTTRLLATLGALAGAASLAACGGGSTGNTFLSNASGQQASIRFVMGSPDAGPVDLYYTTSDRSIAQSPTPGLTNLSYGQITDFTTQTAVSATITIRPAGNATATVPIACQVNQLANNGVYTIVIAGSVVNKTAQCLQYHELAYTQPGQFRMHHASQNLGISGLGTIAYNAVNGTATAGSQVPNNGATATNPGTNANGFIDVGIGGPVSPNTAVSFAIGANTSPNFTAITTLSASSLMTPATPPSSTQPDSGATLPGGGFNNASLFAIDCQGGVPLPAGSSCNGGVALIGSFDTK